MGKEKQLIRLQREMVDLEKKELRLTGSLNTLFSGLKKDLDATGLKNNQVEAEAKRVIKELRKKAEKATKMFSEKMEEIESMANPLEE